MSSQAERVLQVLKDYHALTPDELREAIQEATAEEIEHGIPGIMAARSRIIIHELKQAVGREVSPHGPGADERAIWDLKHGGE